MIASNQANVNVGLAGNSDLFTQPEILFNYINRVYSKVEDREVLRGIWQSYSFLFGKIYRQIFKEVNDMTLKDMMLYDESINAGYQIDKALALNDIDPDIDIHNPQGSLSILPIDADIRSIPSLRSAITPPFYEYLEGSHYNIKENVFSNGSFIPAAVVFLNPIDRGFREVSMSGTIIKQWLTPSGGGSYHFTTFQIDKFSKTFVSFLVDNAAIDFSLSEGFLKISGSDFDKIQNTSIIKIKYLKSNFLFAPVVKRDSQSIFDKFGFLVRATPKTNSELVKAGIRGLFYALINAPSIENIRIAVHVTLGLPFIFHDAVVTSVTAASLTVDETLSRRTFVYGLSPLSNSIIMGNFEVRSNGIFIPYTEIGGASFKTLKSVSLQSAPANDVVLEADGIVFKRFGDSTGVDFTDAFLRDAFIKGMADYQFDIIFGNNSDLNPAKVYSIPPELTIDIFEIDQFLPEFTAITKSVTVIDRVNAPLKSTSAGEKQSFASDPSFHHFFDINFPSSALKLTSIFSNAGSATSSKDFDDLRSFLNNIKPEYTDFRFTSVLNSGTIIGSSAGAFLSPSEVTIKIGSQAIVSFFDSGLNPISPDVEIIDSGPAGGITFSPTSFVNSFSVLGLTLGVYQATVTHLATGDSAGLKVNVVTDTVPTFSGIPPAGSSLTLFQTIPFPITITGGTGPYNLTYTDQSGNPIIGNEFFIVPNPSNGSLILTPNNLGVYDFKITDSNNVITPFTVNVIPLPVSGVSITPQFSVVFPGDTVNFS